MQILKKGKVLVAIVKKSRYGNKTEANRETTSGACTNTVNIDINWEPGPGGSEKNGESKN